MIDLFRPYVPPEAAAAVADVLNSRFIGEGPRVELFEARFSDEFRQPYVVAFNSGTSALETAYDLVGLRAGDEVITTPLTCTATNLMLLRRGCKLVWADILPTTLCIDPEDVKRKMSHRTKAIVQVHLGGLEAQVPTDMGTPVISDAAQALGIFTGHYTCCSFQAIKQLTTGDGGLLALHTENPERDRNNARLYRWFGIDRRKKIKNQWQAYKERKMTFDIVLAGAKRQMNDIAAALGLVGLAHHAENQAIRAAQFARYQSALAGITGITLLDAPVNMHWLATVLVERRDDFAKKLFEADIDTNLVQVRNDVYRIFGGKRQDLPSMNALEDKYLSIPIGPHVSMDEIDYIAATIREGW